MNDQALPDSIPGSDRPDFIVETTNTEADFLTLFGVLMPPLFTVGYPVLGIVSLGFGVFLTALSGAGFLSFLCIISGILLLILRAIYPKRAVKRQCARLRESQGTETLHCRLVFWPEGVVLNNLDTGGKVNLRYDCFARILRTGRHLALRTKEKQVVIIRMSDLANAPGLAPYLAAKCPHAKKKGF